MPWQYRLRGSSAPEWRDVTEKPGLIFQPDDPTVQLEFRRKPKRTDQEILRDARKYVADMMVKAKAGNYVGISGVLTGIDQILKGKY